MDNYREWEHGKEPDELYDEVGEWFNSLSRHELAKIIEILAHAEYLFNTSAYEEKTLLGSGVAQIPDTSH